MSQNVLCMHVPNESSYHTVQASRDVFAQKPKIMDAWMQVLEDRHREDASSIDEGIKIEKKELELD